MTRKTINFYSPDTRETISLFEDHVTGYGYDDYNKLYFYAIGGSRFNVDKTVYISLAGDNLPEFLKDKNEVSE